MPAGIAAYQRVELDNYSVVAFDLKNLDNEATQRIIAAFARSHEKDIAQDVARIKADKTSCQWLVPDEILNAD